MDAKLKAKWIKALRSGRYKQARGRLKRGNAYCCLGVLCQVNRLPIAKRGDLIEGASTFDRYRPIWELIGSETSAKTLAHKNDRGESFSEIADYIETTL